MTTRTTTSSRKPSNSKALKKPPRTAAIPGKQPPQYLFDAWEKVARRARRAEQVVVFLDFDGTLVRLRRRPKEVFLGEPARRLLRRLVRRRRVTICFISGRQLKDLQERARVEGAIYFGTHGWERSNGRPPDLPGARDLRKVMRWVRKQVADIPGVRVEDKGICFGIHYRNALKPAMENARTIAREAMDRLGPDFSLMAGKKIWEIYPTDMGNKGKAAKDLLQQIPGRKLVIYAGDDTTDETAFALLPKGVTIRVGKFQETKANFFVRNPAEVLTFLAKLEETLS